MGKSAFSENACVITGASSGIGRHVALLLAEQGACLALAARRAEQLEAVAAECRQRGGEAIAVPTDVADEKQCRHLIERAVDQYGRLDTLVNNAGYGVVAPFEELPDLSSFEALLSVNFLGSVRCTYHALPHLRRTRGRLVGVCSLAGRLGLPTSAAYCASKHAMAGFFDSLRLELGAAGVSVTVVYPGFVASQFHDRMVDAAGQPMHVDIRERAAGHVMSAEACARRIVRAAARRRRHVVMTASGRLALWLKLSAPGLLDRSLRRLHEKDQQRLGNGAAGAEAGRVDREQREEQ